MRGIAEARKAYIDHQAVIQADRHHIFDRIKQQSQKAALREKQQKNLEAKLESVESLWSTRRNELLVEREKDGQVDQARMKKLVNGLIENLDLNESPAHE
jgi:restriction endonuclease S subunit